MDKIERVSKMEKILGEHRDVLQPLLDALKAYEEHQEAFNELMEYYSSQDWFDDLEASNKGEIPEDIPQGVLSEDAVFDMYGENRDVAIELLKTATKVLSNE